MRGWSQPRIVEEPIGNDASLPVLRGAAGEDYARAVRETCRRLVVLDNEPNGLPIADLAARAFGAVHRRLGEGTDTHRHEREILAAAAELAGIAGWALFSAARFDAARRFNREALFLARLSGNRATELLTLQNMGMLAGWVGRGREELAIARSVLDDGVLPPRVEAMFRAREAQGLAGTGDATETARSFARARSLLQDGAPEDAPGWAWWISEREIDRQQGRVLQEAGQWREAIPILREAMNQDDGAQVGYGSIAAVRLLACLLAVRDWSEAEREARRLLPAVSETSSVVTLDLLARVARRGAERDDAPSDLRDACRRLSSALAADPYVLCRNVSATGAHIRARATPETALCVVLSAHHLGDPDGRER